MNNEQITMNNEQLRLFFSILLDFTIDRGQRTMIDNFSPLLLRKVFNFIRSLGLVKTKPLYIR